MKEALTAALLEAARLDSSVMLLTGDLGYGAFDSFQERLGAQFLNCGVAEQNMVGVSAGLAAEGFKPVVYSIGNFLVFRAAEQIRNDVVAAGRPVLLVAAGGGFTYGAAGYSHHLTEDVAFMRSLPGIDVMVPALVNDIQPMVGDWLSRPRPVYLRLDRTTDVPEAPLTDFKKGWWRTVREGESIGLFSMGSPLEVSIQVADALSVHGVNARVVDCNHLTSLSPDGIDAVLSGITTAVSIEEHSTRGGLGALVAEEITSRGLPITLLRYGLEGSYCPLVGSPTYLRSQHGIEVQRIADRVLARPSGR